MGYAGDLLNRTPVAFGVTPCDKHFGIRILAAGAPNYLTCLLVGGIGDGAGIDKIEIGARGILNDGVAVAEKRLLHRLRVVLVHLASHRNEFSCSHFLLVPSGCLRADLKIHKRQRIRRQLRRFLSARYFVRVLQACIRFQ